MIPTPHPRATQFITTSIIVVVSYAVIALIAGICGVFYAVPVFLLWIISLIILTTTGMLSWTLPSRDCAVPVVGALLFALLIAALTVPTIFDGRDQGSFADAAIRLAATHTFTHHTPESDAFFTLYGRGQALNFPGYFYAPDGALITQFPLPYIAFLAGWYALFGTAGFIVANAILLTLTIVSLIYVARYFLTPRWSMVFFVLLLSSFPLGWFAKYTLSENLAGALLWSAFALLLALWRKPTMPAWIALWATVGLLAATRIEGLWFALFFIGACAASATMRTFVRADAWRRFFVPAAAVASIGLLTFLTSLPFFTVMAKALLRKSPVALSTHMGEKLLALASVYTLYGFIIPLCASIALVIVTVWRHHKYRTSLFPLLPLALVAPLFLYYIFPNITADHPWMLRRFGFALTYATLLASVLFAAGIPGTNTVRRALHIGIPVCILLTQLPAFIYFLPYAEHRTLTTDITAIGHTFMPDDLVLVDRMATGSGWAMMNTLLRTNVGTHAAYIVNPADCARIDTSAFRHVYLIAPDDAIQRYRDALSASALEPRSTYSLTATHLAPAPITTHSDTFPAKRHDIVTGTIYELSF